MPAVANAPLVVPVQLVIDGRARWRPGQVDRFWSGIWPEAVREFSACGIRLESRLRSGEVRRSPGDRPIFAGLDAGVLNLVITQQIPLKWDNGRGWSGVTTRYDGYDLCVIALDTAHGNQVPLILVNTCVHELLHALLGDIFERNPEGVSGAGRELRIDWYATRMWLFHDGRAVREAARSYVLRLRARVRSQP